MNIYKAIEQAKKSESVMYNLSTGEMIINPDSFEYLDDTDVVATYGMSTKECSVKCKMIVDRYADLVADESTWIKIDNCDDFMIVSLAKKINTSWLDTLSLVITLVVASAILYAFCAFTYYVSQNV